MPKAVIDFSFLLSTLNIAAFPISAFFGRFQVSGFQFFSVSAFLFRAPCSPAPCSLPLAPLPLMNTYPGITKSVDIALNAFPRLSQRGTDLRWPVPQLTKPTLAQNEIHLWCAHLDEFFSAVPEFCRALSHDERTRVGSFQFRKDHDYFVIQCGLLRHLLSRYLPVSPAEHEFVRGPHGKPELVDAQGAARLHFNMSHSSSMALYAFTRVTAVGVDIERIRPLEDLYNIARNFFTPRETAALRALPDASRLEAFFNCWTRKEAILKATGQGITDGVDGIEVTVAPNEPARVLSMKGDAGAAKGWSLQALEPAVGYATAKGKNGPELEIVGEGLRTLKLRKQSSHQSKRTSEWIPSGIADILGHNSTGRTTMAGRRPTEGGQTHRSVNRQPAQGRRMS